MGPTPMQLIWSGLKNGLLIWPFETSPGTYFALPIYVVVLILLIPVIAAAVGMHLLSSKSRDNSR